MLHFSAEFYLHFFWHQMIGHFLDFFFVGTCRYICTKEKWILQSNQAVNKVTKYSSLITLTWIIWLYDYKSWTIAKKYLVLFEESGSTLMKCTVLICVRIFQLTIINLKDLLSSLPTLLISFFIQNRATCHLANFCQFLTNFVSRILQFLTNQLTFLVHLLNRVSLLSQHLVDQLTNLMC